MASTRYDCDQRQRQKELRSNNNNNNNDNNDNSAFVQCSCSYNIPQHTMWVCCATASRQTLHNMHRAHLYEDHFWINTHTHHGPAVDTHSYLSNVILHNYTQFSFYTLLAPECNLLNEAERVHSNPNRLLCKEYCVADCRQNVICMHALVRSDFFFIVCVPVLRCFTSSHHRSGHEHWNLVRSQQHTLTLIRTRIHLNDDKHTIFFLDRH